MNEIDPFEIPAFLKAEKRTEGADMKPGPREQALREQREAETKRATIAGCRTRCSIF